MYQPPLDLDQLPLDLDQLLLELDRLSLVLSQPPLEPGPPPLELVQLPLELIQRILSCLDFDSLCNAVLSCRFLFNAFKGAETLITGEVLLQHIDYDVLPEAILVNKSWGLFSCEYWDQLDHDVVMAGRVWNGSFPFCDPIELEEMLGRRESAPTKWTLADAFPLVQFHEIVSYFATRFAREALKKQPRLLETGEPEHEELCRIERALYRFQLYCNLVVPPPQIRCSDLRGDFQFFSYFATWENEQLACIHEYLVRLIVKLDHDITWAALKIAWIGKHSNGYAQGILMRGLTTIYDLCQASGYDEWHDVLSDGYDAMSGPRHVSNFLATWFAENRLGPPSVTLSEMDEELKESVIGEAFYKDADTGPASIWEWLYRDREGRLVGHEDMRIYRQRAWPFWNLSRLKNAGVLENPNIPGPPGRGESRYGELGLEKIIYDRERWLSLITSEKERRIIFLQGGRGWYGNQDTSQVIWGPHPKGRRVRSSLAHCGLGIHQW
ncbi:hypothetical protein CIB48_g12219 [Xylaria polymorpha]|nr:hypothetical protein CIB48_g12219 [Xylaria polymorpha]